MTMDYSSKWVLLMAISLCEIVIISGGSLSTNPASEKEPSKQESTADNNLYTNNHNDFINKKTTTALDRVTGTTNSANNDNSNRNNMQTKTTTTTPTLSSKTATTTTTTINNTNSNTNNGNDSDHNKMKRVSILVEIFLSAVFSLLIISTNLLEVCGIVMGIFLLAVLVLALCLFLRRAAIRRTYTMQPKQQQKEPDTGPQDQAPSEQSQHEYRQLDQRLDEMSTLPLRHSNEYELLGMPSRVCAKPFGEMRAPSLDDLDFPPPPSLDFPPPPPSITASSEHSYLELC